MKGDDDEKKLSELYQQRKNACVAPEVNLDTRVSHKTITQQTPSKSSLWGRMAVALVGGSCASFAIMALITHLVEAPPTTVDMAIASTSQSSIELPHDDLSSLTQQAVADKMNDIKRQPPKMNQWPEQETVLTQRFELDKVEVPHEQLVKNLVLQIKQSAIKVKLVHQVLPEYPRSALLAQQSGYVKLSYVITQTGNVADIEVIETNGHRDLQKSATSALSQWQYLNQEAADEKAEIIFEFNHPQSRQ